MTPELLIALLPVIGVFITVLVMQWGNARKSAQETKKSEVELLREQLAREVESKQRTEDRYERWIVTLREDSEKRLARRDESIRALRQQALNCQEHFSLAVSILEKNGLALPVPRRRSDLTGPLAEYHNDSSSELPAVKP